MIKKFAISVLFSGSALLAANENMVPNVGEWQHFMNVLTLAQGDDAQEQFHLACIYEKKGDKKTALEWYQKSADGGDARAQCTLGWAYYNGHFGLEKDNKKAMDWYWKAYQQGDENASYNLGLICEGMGQYTKAANFYLWSAQKNDPDALYRLGFLYENGFGVVRNVRKAAHLYKLAADLGQRTARVRLNALNDSSFFQACPF